jgi:hypothetical protein
MKTILTITAIFTACLLGACAKKETTTTSSMDSTTTRGYSK